jgi:hypothetical protein
LTASFGGLAFRLVSYRRPIGKERSMPLFIVVMFLVIDLGLGIVGFMAFMLGATGTNRAAFILWLLLNALIALRLATHGWEKRKRLKRRLRR